MALQQLISSYIKLRLLLSEFINFNNLEIELIIGTSKIKEKDKFVEHKEYISQPHKYKLIKCYKDLKEFNECNLSEIIFENRIPEINKNFIQSFRDFQKENIPLRIIFCD